MASGYGCAAPQRYPDVIDILDSDDDIWSVSDAEPTQQDLNNRRLTQAINYLAEEGGEDSPATFIDRVSRIDNALLGQLLQQGSAFDTKLYRRARAMVLDVQRDYQDATHDELIQLNSEDYLPEPSTPWTVDDENSDSDALYRKDDSPTPSPVSREAPHSTISPPDIRRGGSDDDVKRQREFKYGGPNNQVENWHKDFPASPFPETIMMAHRESLMIDYDLSRPKDASIVETDVPFDHPALQAYLNLPQYDSGSRFKLPLVSKENQDLVAHLGNVEEFLKSYNQNDQSEGLTKDYAPRIALPKFQKSVQCRSILH